MIPFYAHMYLDKLNTYAKAHVAVEANKQASIHSNMVLAAAATSSAELNFMSMYKKGQKATSQAGQLLWQPHESWHFLNLSRLWHRFSQRCNQRGLHPRKIGL